MSSTSDRRTSLPGGNGLLRGPRTRSYGSLVNSSLSPPVRQRRIEHQVQPGETIQGLSLKYGVSMEQIKRANRLYTNDSIFLKKSLSIPVLSEPDLFSKGAEFAEDTSQEENTYREDLSENRKPDKISEKEEGTSDLSPMDYLKRIDSMINQSKQAAVKKCQEGEKQFSSMQQLCDSRTSNGQGTHLSSSTSSSSKNQQAMLGAVPLTITKHTKKLRDREDEFFQL